MNKVRRTQRVRKMAKGTLKHWRINLHNARSKGWKDARYDLSSASCAFCAEYLHRDAIGCPGCPLERIGTACTNEDSLYSSVHSLADHTWVWSLAPLKETTKQEELVSAIEDMVRALEYLAGKRNSPD